MTTETGPEVLSARQMRAKEQAAIATGAATGLGLMNLAGQRVVEAIHAKWPDLSPAEARVAILAGPGNNGGDGYVIARLLAARGFACTVHALGDPAALPPDARASHAAWAAIGPVAPLPHEAPPAAGPQGLMIDALLGTGLTRGLSPEVADCLTAFDRPGEPGWRRVAVDVPSGLCADSGRVLTVEDGRGGAAMRADLTVTFDSLKLGHLLAEGPGLCGEVVVADIGLRGRVPDAVRRVEDAAPFRSDLAKPEGHKFSHGHVLVASGGAGRTGAARLAARAALRVGAGLVTLATPHEALAENAAHVTAIMLAEADDAAAFARRLEDGRLTALVLGPGLGLARAASLVPVALATRRAVVLDADALTAFQDDPAALFAMLHPEAVLTPHMGEFARLFPDLAARLAGAATAGPAFSKVDAAQAAAERAGAVVLLKGVDTVIASPDGRVALHAAIGPRAAPWLATAGAGDVLAGLIAGLMARGMAGFGAARAGVFLHVEAARAFGPGLIAEDLPEALPGVLRGLVA